MGSNRSVMSCFELMILLLGFTLVFVIGFSDGVTNPSDVTALNKLYVALGSPPLLGWVDSGGDPCSGWQGVSCDAASSIEEINLMGANLGGELGDSLGEFSSIKHLLFTDNHITGSIPSELPPSLIQLFLADNNLTGTIPSSLSSLTALSDLSLNNNQLNGEIPDAFGGMAQLSNLDLSGNSLSGQLPPSLGNLSVLKILHMQDNQLSGTLDVLQDLRLTDLDVRNNQFIGPIPAKMLNIPNFQTEGNSWNSTPPLLTPPPIPSETPPLVLPATPPFFPGPTSRPPPPNSVQPPPTSGLRTPPSIVHTPPSSLRTPPSSLRTPPRQAEGPSATIESNSGPSNNKSKRRIVWISIASVMAFIILILAILLCMPRCLRKKRDTYRIPKRHEIAPYTGSVRENPSTSFLLHRQNEEKAPPPVPVVRPKEENRQRIASSIPKRNEVDGNNVPISVVPRRNYHEIDLSFDMDVMPPPPPPPPASPPPAPPPPPSGKVIVNPITATEAKPLPATSVKSYTIAALQQYTHSFSQENLIGGGMLGNVYRAELPNGRFLAVKKLDKRVTNKQSEEQFIELVNNLDKIHQANVVQLMGFCSEHGQRLLVYEYCGNGTLQDALHSDDEFKKQLTWNTRIRMALGAAKALEYLHEFCEPPVIHRNFKAINVLLDDELYVNVSDCGLAPLISSGGVSQLSGQLLTTYGYGAPEFESGVYTSKSDVYSFGVVMLELLTGRMSYDRTRSRGEQILVRWAIPQLHDIDALSRMVDPSLNGNYHVKSLSRFADIISRCVLIEPEFRPLMSEVVQDLMQMLRRDSPSISSDGD